MPSPEPRAVASSSLPGRLVPWIERLLLLVLGVVGLRIALALSGFLEPVYPRLPNLSAPGLIGPLCLHAAYGLGLTVLVFGLGGLPLALIGRRTPLTDSDHLIFAWPAGLLIVLAAALGDGLGAVDGNIPLVLLGVGSVAGLGLLWPRFKRGRLLTGLTVVVLALAAGYGVFMGISWRPGGADWIGTVDLGDLTIYTGWYHTLHRQFFPFVNLGVEGEFLHSYFNQAPTLLALLADGLPGFDPALFFATTLIAFLILSLFVVIRGLSLAAVPGTAFASSDHWLAIGLLVAANARPSWTVESPPVVLLLPLIAVVAYAVHRAGPSTWRLLLAVMLAALASIGSKVASLLVLGGYAGLALVVRRWGRLSRRQLVLIGLLSLVLGGYVLAMVVRFAPDFLAYWDVGPDSWHRFREKGWEEFDKVIPDLARDLALIPLLIGAYRVGGVSLAGAVAAGVLTFLLHFQLFRVEHMTAFALVAMVLILEGSRTRSGIKWLAAATVLTLPYAFFRDPGESEAALVWIAVAVPTIWFARFATDLPESADGAQRFDRAVSRVALGVLVLAVVALPALALGTLRIGDNRRTVTPIGLVDLWDGTRRLTPENALVFTDQTGNDPRRLSGWNDFALRAERQFYIATWASSRLRLDDEARQRRLALNEAVLAGTCAPSDLQLSRHYDSWYAAVLAHRPVPDHFEPVFSDRTYALYRIRNEPDTESSASCTALKEQYLGR
jgi:hypothetical protein